GSGRSASAKAAPGCRQFQSGNPDRQASGTSFLPNPCSVLVPTLVPCCSQPQASGGFLGASKSSHRTWAAALLRSLLPQVKANGPASPRVRSCGAESACVLVLTSRAPRGGEVLARRRR